MIEGRTQGGGEDGAHPQIPDDSDRVSPDEDDEDMSPYEPTYRDGSAKNECWRDDDG